MAEKLYKTIPLKNKLLLEIWDQSRHLAGDRWLVRAEARIEIPFAPKYLKFIKEKGEMVTIIKEVFGESLPYRHAVERNFIDQARKQEVFRQCVDTLEKNTVAYLSHPEFAKRLTLSKCLELKVKRPQIFQDQMQIT